MNKFNTDDFDDTYSIYNRSLAQQLLKNGAMNVVTHNWKLGQDASSFMSKHFYKNSLELF